MPPPPKKSVRAYRLSTTIRSIGAEDDHSIIQGCPVRSQVATDTDALAAPGALCRGGGWGWRVRQSQVGERPVGVEVGAYGARSYEKQYDPDPDREPDLYEPEQ